MPRTYNSVCQNSSKTLAIGFMTELKYRQIPINLQRLSKKI